MPLFDYINNIRLTVAFSYTALEMSIHKTETVIDAEFTFEVNSIVFIALLVFSFAVYVYGVGISN